MFGRKAEKKAKHDAIVKIISGLHDLTKAVRVDHISLTIINKRMAALKAEVDSVGGPEAIEGFPELAEKMSDAIDDMIGATAFTAMNTVMAQIEGRLTNAPVH